MALRQRAFTSDSFRGSHFFSCSICLSRSDISLSLSLSSPPPFDQYIPPSRYYSFTLLSPPSLSISPLWFTAFYGSLSLYVAVWNFLYLLGSSCRSILVYFPIFPPIPFGFLDFPFPSCHSYIIFYSHKNNFLHNFSLIFLHFLGKIKYLTITKSLPAYLTPKTESSLFFFFYSNTSIL